MQLLLVPQKEITSGKASLAFGTLKRLLLGVGPLVALQMLQSGEGALASSAYMWPGLVCLRRRKLIRGFGIHGN